MIRKFSLFFFLFFSCFAFSQWINQATGFTITKRGINSISIVDQNIVWAVAYDGTNTSNFITEFTRTSDGGNTWSPGLLNSGIVGAGIGNISAINADTAWACIYHPTQTAAGGIWRTNDGGISWNKQTSAAFIAASFPDFVHFWNASDGIAVGDPTSGYFEVYTTSDGGNNWVRTANTNNQLSSVSPSEYGYVNAFSVYENVLWFCTSAGRVFKTSDFGLTFTSSVVGNGINDVQRVTFSDSLLGYAAMHTPNNMNFRLAKTNDGGLTWNACANNSTLTQTALLGGDVCAIPGTNYLISIGSDIYAKGSSFSADGGATWFIMEDTSLAPQRTCVRFLDASTGWAGSFNTDQFSEGISKNSGPVGINSLSVSSSFRFFPNPAGNFVSLLIKNNLDHAQIRLLSADGQELQNNKINLVDTNIKIDVDLSTYDPGIYILEFYDGIKLRTEKIVHY